MKLVLGMEVGISPGDFVLDGNPVPARFRPFPPKGAQPLSPIFGPFLFGSNGSMHQDTTWYGCWPQPRGLCVRWRPSLPSSTKGAEPLPIFGPFLLFPNGWMHQDATRYGGRPQFSVHFYCGQTARCIKMPLDMDVGLSPGDFVLDGDPVLPPQQRGRSPSQFSAHFYCAQTAGCIKMPLGMEVGVFVLDGDPAPSPKGGQSPLPIFNG